MDILEWSQRHLVFTGAAEVCPLHGLITASEDVRAVNQAVSIGRDNPLSNIAATSLLSRKAAATATMQLHLASEPMGGTAVINLQCSELILINVNSNCEAEDDLECIF
jgi:hypothetical protein